MGEGFQNKPLEITPGTPKDVAGLRKSLMSLLSQKMSEGATPYGGQLSSGLDPLQIMASNMMSQQMYSKPYGGGVGTGAGPGGGMPGTGMGSGGGSGAGGRGFNPAPVGNPSSMMSGGIPGLPGTSMGVLPSLIEYLIGRRGQPMLPGSRTDTSGSSVIK